MKLALCSLSLVAVYLAGCTSYRLDRPEQLYLAQSYLPLPRDYQVPRDLPPPAPYIPASESGCWGTQAADWRRPTGTSRESFQVLPGMTLLVTETTYRRNGASGVPVSSEWPWTLPAARGCGGDRAWERADLLKVRHLLSGARIKDSLATPDTDYYLQLVRWGGCAGAGGCSFTHMRRQLLEPFVSSLEIRYRGVGPNYESGTSPVMPPDAVASIPLDGSNLAAWLGQMTSVQPQDFFQFPLPADLNLGMDMGQLCARLTSRRAAAPVFIDTARTRTASAGGPGGHNYQSVGLPVCNFMLKRLSLVPPETWPEPGSARFPALGSEVVLLGSSDPLMLFRPPAYRHMLDSSGRLLCPQATPGDTACGEDERLGQGFVDFETLIEIRVAGKEEPLRVPSMMSVEQFEHKHGGARKVVAVERPAVWLPKNLALFKLTSSPQAGGVVPTASLASAKTLTINFMQDESEEWRRRSGIFVKDSLKSHVILAPGDLLTLKR